MPHMNEVFELLESAKNHLISQDALIALKVGSSDTMVLELVEKIDQILHEWKMLKTGNLARA